jgi:uncharacterized protein (DUF1501 family)
MSTNLTHHDAGDHEADDCGCSPRVVGRRGFLGGAAGLTALGLTGGLSSLGNMSVAFADPSTTYNDNILVVVSIRGGFDGLSAVMPLSDPYYIGAKTVRPTIGITAAQAIQLDNTTTWGMHPALQPLASLYTGGQLAFVHDVGQEDPTMSHFDAEALMEQGEPGQPDRSGWIERLATQTGPAGSDTFAEVSLGPSMAPASTYGSYPTTAMQSLSSFKLNVGSSDYPLWAKALPELQAGGSTYVQAPTKNAVKALSAVAGLSSSSPQNGASYPTGSTDLARSLSDLAKLIRAGGVRVAAVDSNGTNYRGWDMHVDMGAGSDQNGWIWSNLQTLGASLAAFAQDLGPTLMSKVTLVTLSEFGRRVYENDSGGVDHGHGNLMMVMGGGINGGNVLGHWSGLAPYKDGGLDINGNLPGSNDYRTVIAEILSKRLNFGTADIKAVFPKTGKIDPMANWVGVAS